MRGGDRRSLEAEVSGSDDLIDQVIHGPGPFIIFIAIFEATDNHAKFVLRAPSPLVATIALLNQRDIFEFLPP
jgi:hypothetical protein